MDSLKKLWKFGPSLGPAVANRYIIIYISKELYYLDIDLNIKLISIIASNTSDEQYVYD